MKVPFVDLKAQHESIKDEINHAIQEVINSTAFSGGPFVERFEEQFSEFCNTRYCVGVSSGTDALWLALLANGVGEGDEVITVPNSFIATAEAISRVGGHPVFVDVDDRFQTLNPELLSSAISECTRAIVPVHLFGQTADMDPIMAIARKHNLVVIEDACQAHGALYKGRKAGSMGEAAAFSFYPGKNLGAYGEAGALVTNSSKIYEKARMLRNHGQDRKYYHRMVGWNARMDGIQAAVLSVKLQYLDDWNEARRQKAIQYDFKLGEMACIVIPVEAEYARHIYHVYAIRISERDAVLESLRKKYIQTGIHYPVPLHMQEAYRELRIPPGSYPVVEKCNCELLSLPLYPELSEAQIEYVVTSLRELCS